MGRPRKERKGQKKCSKYACRLPKFDEKHSSSHPKSSMNSKQEKCKENFLFIFSFFTL
jgi:hypothetical protein